MRSLSHAPTSLASGSRADRRGDQTLSVWTENNIGHRYRLGWSRSFTQMTMCAERSLHSSARSERGVWCDSATQRGLDGQRDSELRGHAAISGRRSQPPLTLRRKRRRNRNRFLRFVVGLVSPVRSADCAVRLRLRLRLRTRDGAAARAPTRDAHYPSTGSRQMKCPRNASGHVLYGTAPSELAAYARAYVSSARATPSSGSSSPNT